MAARYSRKHRRRRSGLSALLGSHKTTLFLGLLALASIFYYKFCSVSPPLQKAPSRRMAITPRRGGVLAPGLILGRSRPKGPLLTRSFFHTGDLVLAGKLKAPARLGVVRLASKKVQVLEPSQRPTPLLAWIREAGGRFALYRLPPAARRRLPPFPRSWQRVAPAPRNPVQAIRRFYQQAGIDLPRLEATTRPTSRSTTLPASPRARFFLAFLKQSHYNDLTPWKIDERKLELLTFPAETLPSPPRSR